MNSTNVVPVDFGSTTPLRVTADVNPPSLDVRLEGEIDLACVELLEAMSQVELVGITLVTLDLSDLSFSDVAGLRAMLKFHNDHSSDQREVRLVHAQPIVRRVFELAGASEYLAA